MTTVDNHRQASHKPLHAGDMESVLWGIENDPLSTYHGLLRDLNEKVKPSATALDGVLNALRPAVRPLLGTLLEHNDFAVSNISVGDHLAGDMAVALYPYGPLMGRAANCCLSGYGHRAFAGIYADAAAAPDLGMLAGYIREGFSAVTTLADVGL